VITLVLGGVRSGKSEVAERLVAGSGGPVTYVATARATGDDESMATRIDAHRRRRPAEWATVEVDEDLDGALLRIEGTVLVDSLGTWLARLHGLDADASALCRALEGRRGDTVLVSEEVGLSVHPVTAVGRQFQDALGSLNRQVAHVADRVLLVIAGRVLALEQA
jgi:adenosyl cobinamide kinase/adenosyl cobinamide phosphate guanylyltransferase